MLFFSSQCLSHVRVGITSSVNLLDYETPQQHVVMLPLTYVSAVQKANAAPLLLPEGDPRSVDRILDGLDGLIVAGGRDIDPLLFDEERHSQTTGLRPSQDAWEVALVKGACARDMPILGICRGHQLLCLMHGGALHQHLPTTSGHEQHGGWGGEWTDHEVEVEPSSQLAQALGGFDRVQVNSGHHQGVASAGSLRVVARSCDDGLVEAAEAPGLSFCLSMQWHPEMLGQAGVFSAFVRACAAGHLSPRQRTGVAMHRFFEGLWNLE
jgi:putative glutamine amidotransferase